MWVRAWRLGAGYLLEGGCARCCQDIHSALARLHSGFSFPCLFAVCTRQAHILAAGADVQTRCGLSANTHAALQVHLLAAALAGG